MPHAQGLEPPGSSEGCARSSHPGQAGWLRVSGGSPGRRAEQGAQAQELCSSLRGSWLPAGGPDSWWGPVRARVRSRPQTRGQAGAPGQGLGPGRGADPGTGTGPAAEAGSWNKAGVQLSGLSPKCWAEWVALSAARTPGRAWALSEGCGPSPGTLLASLPPALFILQAGLSRHHGATEFKKESGVLRVV